MTEIQNTPLSRRGLIAGVIGAGLVAAACGAAPKSITASRPAAGGLPAPSPRAATPTPATRKFAPTPQDVQIAQLAAGLEVLAVGTYTAALDAATAGALGDVPPAVAEFVTTAKAHHEAHRDAWNEVLTSSGAAAVTAPNATLKPTVDSAFAAVTDVAGAAGLALMLEQIAAATYLNAQGVLTDKAAVELAGSIQVVDAQHASVLLFVLGQYPVPDTFATVDAAVGVEGVSGDAGMPSTK